VVQLLSRCQSIETAKRPQDGSSRTARGTGQGTARVAGGPADRLAAAIITYFLIWLFGTHGTHTCHLTFGTHMAGGETIDPACYYGKVISPESTVMQTRVRAISDTTPSTPEHSPRHYHDQDHDSLYERHSYIFLHVGGCLLCAAVHQND
jgi:hypothetical protein